MIKFIKGNLLNAKTEALVNTVNTVGVMGKGIALQFKNRFPYNYKVYREACKNKMFKTGQVLTVQDGDLLNQQYIVNFPTKAHWKSPSKIEYIQTGLVALKNEIAKLKIKSIAIPPLGCGNGGLNWDIVKEIMIKELESLDIEIIIYEPNTQIKQVLQKEEIKAAAKLTPARAMLLYLMFNYEKAGEQSSLFVANKLAYFLQRKGEKLRLKFEAHHYGPYAVQVNHVLLHLNGTFLKGMEQNMPKPFEPLQLNYNKFEEVNSYVKTQLNSEQIVRLESVIQLLNRFESTFALELLATVDYIKSNDSAKSVDEVLESISKWSTRKINLFKPQQVELALTHLSEYSSKPFSV
ncbi:type II toxin-antitoxin system antitoxin DNA ADP-ribosyl glycohydrolase DarG [Polaribacter sargassicola]|uniref:type II toxin-antitoxin system antitoxin DNA ADP-ribosyl glycohydrolase DarG n=1 Tax=Polaribacter sargassicola TaxID=2836891 RepID=UPI001F374528|nr:macro domain-containing protein [Polaribacter sp. DS7-9]MCG1035512.1 macro domain-containing protein [Polaribacter sp. DS7-9]